jgi:hypothetical protein
MMARRQLVKFDSYAGAYSPGQIVPLRYPTQGPSLTMPRVRPYVVFREALSSTAVVDLAKLKLVKAAKRYLYRYPSGDTAIEGYASIPYDQFDAVYYRMLEVVTAVNDDAWRLAVSGIVEPGKIMAYGQGGERHWHVDYFDGNASKVTAIVMLSTPKDYLGGGLQMVEGGDVEESLEPGDAVIFPSWMAHRVLRVKGGLRKTAVFWIAGPDLR